MIHNVYNLGPDGGGFINTASGACSFVGGGDTNIASSDLSFLGGGYNQIGNAASIFIGGGSHVASADHAAIVGGNFNQASGPLTFIGGGSGNVVTQQGNAILGGVNNNDGTLAGVMIVGNNIPAAIPNALHINGLWANGIPGPYTAPPSFPSGTVWYGPPGIASAFALYIIP